MQRRNAEYIGKRMLCLELPGKRRRKTKDEVYGCGKGGHVSGWSVR